LKTIHKIIIFSLFEQKMHNNLFILKQNHYHMKGIFVAKHYIFFSILFCLLMCHESQTWPLKNYKLHVVCRLILSNSPHLIIGSKLNLIHSELWVSLCCHAHFKVFCLCLGLPKNVTKILDYCILWYLLYITIFGLKWLSCNVLSLISQCVIDLGKHIS
jgi:hypothetical protein